MTTPNAGRVEIEVVADGTDFDRELGRKVRESMKRAQATATEGGREVGEKFTVSVQRNIDTDAINKPLRRSVRSAGVIGSRAGSAFSRGFVLKAAAGLAALTIQPVGAVAVGALGAAFSALATPLAAATAGVGAFAIVAIPSISKVVKASEELAKAQEAVDNALTSKARETALKRQAQLIASLDPAQRAAVKSLDRLKSSFRALQVRLQGDIFGVFQSGLDAAGASLPHIERLAKATAPALRQILEGITKGLGGKGAKDAVTFLAARAPAAIKGIATGVANFGRGIASLVRGFGPLTGGINQGLGDLLRKFSTIGESQGFRKFIGYVQQNAPLVRETLRSIGEAVVKILDAVRPLGPLALGSLGLIAGLITAIPTDTLTRIIEAFLLLKATLLVYNTVAAIATLQTTLLNAAFLANPVGLVIAGIFALGAAFIYAYKQSETFRDIVNPIIRAIGGAVTSAVSGILGAIIAVFDALGRLPGKAGKNFRDAAKSVRGMKATVDALGIAIENVGRKKANPSIKLMGVGEVEADLIRLERRITNIGGVQVRLPVKAPTQVPRNTRGGVVAAEGGIVRRPTYLLAGEAGPEAIIPLSETDGNGPLTPRMRKMGQGSGGGVTVTQQFYVQEKQDADALQRQAAFRFRVAAGG